MSENSAKMPIMMVSPRYSNVLFCPTNIRKLKEIQFTIIYEKESNQIRIFEKLGPANVCCSSVEYVIKNQCTFLI